MRSCLSRVVFSYTWLILWLYFMFKIIFSQNFKEIILVLLWDIILVPSALYVTYFFSRNIWDSWWYALIWVPPTLIYCTGYLAGPFHHEARVFLFWEFSCIIYLIIFSPYHSPPIVYLFASWVAFQEGSSIVTSNFSTEFVCFCYLCIF